MHKHPALLLVVALIVLTLGALLLVHRSSEGFTGSHAGEDPYVARGATRFNVWAGTQDPSLHSGAASAGAQGGATQLTASLEAATETLGRRPDTAGAMGAAPYLVQDRPRVAAPPTPDLIANARRCEELKGRSACEGMSEWHKVNCGVCLEGGVTHDGRPSWEGGLLLSVPARKAEADAAARAGRNPQHNALLGSCPANRFVVVDPATGPDPTGATCVKARKRLACEEAGAPDKGGWLNPSLATLGCAQCLEGTAPKPGGLLFVYSGPTQPRAFPIALRVYLPGPGAVTVRRGGTVVAGPKTSGDSGVIILEWKAARSDEVVEVEVRLEEARQMAGGVAARGILAQWEGEDPRDPGVMHYSDDVVTRLKPLEDTVVAVNGADAAPPARVLRRMGSRDGSILFGSLTPEKMVSGFQMSTALNWIWGPSQAEATVKLRARTPLLAEPAFAEDAAPGLCPTGELVDNAEVAARMGAAHCPLGVTPAKASDECLQDLVGSAGCDPAFYLASAADKAAARALPSQDALLAAVGDTRAVATTGRAPPSATTAAARRDAVNAAAKRCFGGEALSPCEVVAEDSGSGSGGGGMQTTVMAAPLSAECLDHLWRNSGKLRSRAQTEAGAAVPYTYRRPEDRYSGVPQGEVGATPGQADGSTFGTCTRRGRLAPISATGAENAAAVAAARAKGPLAAVQDFYDGLHQRANWGVAGDREGQVAALQDCYGVEVKQPAAPAPAAGTCGPAVADLGAYGIGPWGATASYPDPAARWVWTSEGAAGNARVGTEPSALVREFSLPAEVAGAVLHLHADDWAEVYLDGVRIGAVGGGWSNPGYPRVNVPKLSQGPHRLGFRVTNGGGPAGIVASLLGPDGRTVLLRTDATWRMQPQP